MPVYKVVLAPVIAVEAKSPQEVMEEISKKMKIEIMRKDNQSPPRLFLVHAGEEASVLNPNPMQGMNVEELEWTVVSIDKLKTKARTGRENGTPPS